MAFIQYYWKVICSAFGGSWKFSELLAGVLALIGSFLAWKYPHWEPIVRNLLWMIPAGLFAIILVFRLILIAPYEIYKTQEQKISELGNRFMLRLGTALFMESEETKGSLMFVELEVINLGSPSVIIGWQARLKLGSEVTSRVLPTTIPDEFRILGDGGKPIAKFTKDNLLENKAIEEPLGRGARVAGWLRFDFAGITKDQLANAEKTIYVHDLLDNEYSLGFKELGPLRNVHLPGAGIPPFSR